MDGVYDADPAKVMARPRVAQAVLRRRCFSAMLVCDSLCEAQVPHARLQKKLSYERALIDNLRVMDQTAITLCKENGIKVVVFNLITPGEPQSDHAIIFCATSSALHGLLPLVQWLSPFAATLADNVSPTQETF